MRSALRLLIGVLVLSHASPALANFGDVYGFGARASAMAGTHTALANDVSALHYNIAGMTLGKPGFTIGFHSAMDDVTIAMKPRPQGYDLPDMAQDSPRIPSKYRLRSRGDVTDLPNLYQVLIGGTWSLGIAPLRLGFAAMLPANGLGGQRASYPDEREQYHSNNLDFDLIGRRSNSMTLLAGAAFALFDWLSVGAGMSIMPTAETQSSVYLPDASQQDVLDMAVTNDQRTQVGFNVGVLVQPHKNLRLGASWRSENYFQIKVTNGVQIKGFQGDATSFPVQQAVDVIANYTPDTLSFGAAWQQGTVTLAADAVVAKWSGYRNRQGERPRTFNDTVSVRLGGEIARQSGPTFRAGLSWEPSPVPPQTGRTNYVDNDRARLTVGAGHAIELRGQSFELNWAIGLQHLMPRDTDKASQQPHPTCGPGVTVLCDEIDDTTPDPISQKPDPAYEGLQTGSPGFPGWQSFGDLLSVGVDLKWRF
ncbi:MAG: outer membrane protein transport protein [Myxococcales bacterium]|nr:outer membrane protein transport protein [Myxococcales bacterium]